MGAQIEEKDQICENILIYQPSLQLAHRNFAAEYFLLQQLSLPKEFKPD